MLYIVTGAAGHLGNTIVKMLAAAGKKVRALVLPQERGMAELPPSVTVVEGNVLKPTSLEKLVEGVQEETVLIHCAGIVSIGSRFFKALFDVNVQGTKNIIELCKMHEISRLVYVSSVHAIPELPTGQVIRETRHFSPDRVTGYYAKSKATATELVLQYAAEGHDACVVHPSGIIGPGDYGHGHITQLLIDYCRGALHAGVAKGGYDFVDVRDVAQGIINCCAYGRSGECYILSNQYYSVKELLEAFHRVTGLKRIKAFLPLWLAKVTSPFSELYYKLRKTPPLFTPYSIYTLSSNANFSHTKADNELHYHTRPLEETVSDTVKWLKSKRRIPSPK